MATKKTSAQRKRRNPDGVPWSDARCRVVPPPRYVPESHPQQARIDRLGRLLAVWHRGLVRWLQREGYQADQDAVANAAMNEKGRLRTLAAKAGVDLLAVGTSRMVFTLKGDRGEPLSEVVKIEYNPAGEPGGANLRELRRWVFDPVEVARWYAPITAAAQDLSLITMMQAAPLLGFGPFKQPEGSPLFGDSALRYNWGWHCRRKVLVDYAGD